MKKLLSMCLACILTLGILPTAAFAASTEEEALGEVDIYNGGYELSYLSINGRIRTQEYTYFKYEDAKGQMKEVPAYCVTPNIKGVPQTVGVGESIGPHPGPHGVPCRAVPWQGCHHLPTK